MATRRSSLTLRYLRYYVSAIKNGVVYNPTSTPVQFAFVPPGVDPGVGNWVTASWETEVGPPTRYVARCLVGPGGVAQLTKGTYAVWIQITDSPEIPQEPIDTIQIV